MPSNAPPTRKSSSPSSKLNTTPGQETSQNNTTPLKSDQQAVSNNSNMPSNAAPFFVNQQLEAIDENETPQKWYKANVVQVDLAEQKILVHFKVILGCYNTSLQFKTGFL